MVRYTITEDQYRKMYVKYKEVDAYSRNLTMTRDANIPKQTTVLSLKEGRIFFIGGSIFDKTSSCFIEYLEEWNMIYPHSNMNIERQNHWACFCNSNIYAIGGYNFDKNEWLNTIESIKLPERPQIDYQFNYDTISIFKPHESNQDPTSPRCDWTLYDDKMKYNRSNMAVVVQLERYIYIFCGKYGKPDSLQPSLINIESHHTIERFDWVEEKWEEYEIKSCHKINKMFSPGAVLVASLKRKNPGVLLFGGKTEIRSKKSIKQYENVVLMFPQSNKSRQLDTKYFVKGKQFKIKMINNENNQKKSKGNYNLPEVELFNGDIEWIKNPNIFTEDQYYYYFLGCRDKWEKLERHDLVNKTNKELFDKWFGKHVDPDIETSINKDDNIRLLHHKMFGIEGLKFNNFEHPKHGHSIFMLDKSTLKWTSMPVIKYIPSKIT